MKSKILVFLVCSLFIPAILFSANTGKIVGSVVDKDTGDLLPGANILIVGTSMGAATDIYGKFIILNVPVGTYSLQATYIGYNSVTFENIRVHADLTTTVNFELTATTIMGEAVTIVAERPLVQTSATNVTRIQSFEEFKNIPARSVTAIIQLQPGVVERDGSLYVRGGRREEIGYYLEGAATRDVMSGVDRARIIPDAVEEIQLQAGGYDAEFGGANAGIIRQTLRSGGPVYRFSIQAETDNFADNGKKFLDTYSYGYSDYTVTASGPLPVLGNKLKFFVAGQNMYYADRIRRFWKGFDFNHADTYIDNRNFPLVTTNYADTIKQGLHMVDGNMPKTNQNTYIGTATLVYDAFPVRLRFSANLSHSRWLSGSNGYGGILNLDRQQVNMNSDGLYTLKVTHLLNPNTYYEVNLNYFDYRYRNYDPLLKDNYWAYWDSTANAAEGVSFLKWSSANVGNAIDIYGFDFTRPGTPGSYDLQRRSYLGGSFTFTSQIKQHEIRFGGDYKRWTVRSWGINEQLAFTTRLTNPDIYNGALAGNSEDLGKWLANTAVNNYGYDLWGNEIDDNQFGLDGPKHPTFFSAFIQDKFEVKQLVIRAGLRLDGFNNDDFTYEDPRNPAWDRNLHIIKVDEIIKSGFKYYVSPRIGLAFPATDRTVFHVQYGKFIQEPRMDDIYVGQRTYDQMYLGGFAFMNPPAIGLDPQRTTQYEVGFNQQFTENASFDITAFYKDIQGWITTGRVIGGPTDVISYYNIKQNGAFSTNKGVEFSLTLRRTNRLAGQVNYTYSSSLGTASASTSTIAGTEQGTQVPTIIMPLDFHRPHVGSVNFDYRFGDNDGGVILQKTGVNFLFRFASGHPYTLRSGAFGQQDVSVGGEIRDTRNRNPLEAVNSSMTPWTFMLDVRLDKTIDLGPMAANFYVYVQNLTNRRNVRNVYMRTGNPWDDGFKSDTETSGPMAEANGGEDIFWSLYNALNLAGNGSNSQSGQLFERPREIRFGVRLEY
ncbi:MAG: TonB-dependent receptor [bacterium]|nr:TonB-dependent receptor [bacterium]